MMLLPPGAVSFLFSNLCSPVWFFFFTVLGSPVFSKGSPAGCCKVCSSTFFSSDLKEVVPFDCWNHCSAVCWCLWGGRDGGEAKELLVLPCPCAGWWLTQLGCPWDGHCGDSGRQLWANWCWKSWERALLLLALVLPSSKSCARVWCFISHSKKWELLLLIFFPRHQKPLRCFLLLGAGLISPFLSAPFAFFFFFCQQIVIIYSCLEEIFESSKSPLHLISAGS